MLQLPEVEKKQVRPRREQDPQKHHGFRPLPSGTEREYISIVFGHTVCGDLV